MSARRDELADRARALGGGLERPERSRTVYRAGRRVKAPWRAWAAGGRFEWCANLDGVEYAIERWEGAR